MNKIKNICVFASSSNYVNSKFFDDARVLGLLLGKNNYNIVYGGSTLGLMWECAENVHQNGGKIIGIMPRKLIDMGCCTDNCDEFYPTLGMRERKALMDEKSDAVIALAGGFGTLEELSEMIVQKQLGYNKKPIIILNTDNFYGKLLEFFDAIVDEKFANKIFKDLIFVANTPQEAIEYLNSYIEPATIPSKHDIYAR